MEQNLVSVIMPAYNSEKYIKQSIDSVLSQTYRNFELIICDNDSTDNTSGIISQYEENDKIKTVSCQIKGVSFARNRCLEEASGKYIAFLDSDDLWHKEKLEKQIDFMEKNNVPFSYSGYDYINEKSEKMEKKPRGIKSQTSYRSLLTNNYIGLLTVILTRDALNDLKFQNIRHEDYVMWLQILKRNVKCEGLREILASYRISSSSLSADKLKAARWRYEVYRKTEGFSVVKSMVYFMLYALNGIARKL